ncbi:DUF4126 family protein [Flavobacteriaceae bacterium Ap0902]|nr:DUF4126 family protein [Flavobacteriaceae bacterium Ap0902]
MDTISIIMAFFLGIGLSASAGFRVFLPLFALSLAARFGFDLSEEWAWVGSWTAIITLGAATFFEIIAYYIPWVDNALDTLAVPMAGIAGTLLMALSLGDMDSQVIQWGLAIIAGGGTAATIKGSSAGTRAASTATTGGAGNFIVSSTETAAAGLLSATSLIWAPLAFILVLVVFYYIYKGWRYIRNVKIKKPKNSYK